MKTKDVHYMIAFSIYKMKRATKSVIIFSQYNLLITFYESNHVIENDKVIVFLQMKRFVINI